VRHEREYEKIVNYIEENPVRAGIVSVASDYRWSSAGWATKGSAPLWELVLSELVLSELVLSELVLVKLG